MEAVRKILDERLARACDRPLALALSGGGDSVALLLMAAEWAKDAARPLLVLTVDHALQPDSRHWTDACRTRAESLGARFQALAWEGPKPERGLPAAAREARHRLLAAAAREAGARVILIGHTADDVLEARRMREAGASTPEPRLWSPSPAWPQGRGVFLLRPLLGFRRAQLRTWLAARGESWIEDPANQDLRFARARARRLVGEAESPTEALRVSGAALARDCETPAPGLLAIERSRLTAAPAADVRAFVSAVCLSAAGTRRPPDRARLDRLVERLIGDDRFVASLAGARIEAEAELVRFLREAGERARGGLAMLQLRAGETGVWDGRFEVAAPEDLEVRPLAGLAARLSEGQRLALAAFPASSRPALPTGVLAGELRCLALSPDICRPLALDRLQAACGQVEREPL